MTGTRPLLWPAVALWAASVACLVAGVVAGVRRRRRRVAGDGGKGSARPVVYLVSLAVFGGAAGTGALLAGPGEMGSPSPEIAEPIFEVSPAASPLVRPEQAPATDTAHQDPVAPSPTSVPSPSRPAGPFEVGFDSVGRVDIDGPEDSIPRVFGEPTSVRPDDSLGKTTKAYVYENPSLSLTIYTFDGKVVYYSAGSSNFKTFSGVEVGDSLDKLKETYGARLEEEGGRYRLTGSKGRVVVFRMEGRKIVRIEGGKQIG